MNAEQAQPDVRKQEDGLREDLPQEVRTEKQVQENLSLEELFAQVEQCIAQLENPQASLEDAFRYYEEGIKKLRACNEKVDQIEKQMLMVNSQGELEGFSV